MGRLNNTIDFLIQRRTALCFASLVMCLLLGAGMTFTTFDTSLSELLSEDNPQLDELEEMAQRFPSPLTATFAFTSGTDDAVFNQRLLGAIRDLQDSYTAVPGATRMSSILNYRSPQFNFQLFERASEDYSAAELAELVTPALSDPVLTSTLLTADVNVTFANLFLDSGNIDAGRTQIAAALLDLTDQLRTRNPDVDIYVNSELLFEQASRDAMVRDLTTLLPAVILICVLTICWCFRSLIIGACILCQALLALVTTVGIAGYTGLSFNTVTVIAPLIVVIISVAHSVHIISLYKKYLHRHEKAIDSIKESIRYNFKPVLLASITTAIGFLSLNLSSSPAIQDFGRVVAIGIGAAWLLSFTLLPSLLVFASSISRQEDISTDAMLPHKLASWIAKFWPRWDRTLFIGGSALALVTCLMLPLNETDFDRLDFIQSDSEIGDYYDMLTERLEQGPSLVYGVATDVPEGAIEPALLHQVDDFSDWLRSLDEVENVGSLVEVVKTIHLSRGGQDPAYYRIPDDVNAIAMDLGAYQSIEYEDFPLDSFLDRDASTMRLVVSAGALSNQQLIDLDNRIQQKFSQDFPSGRLIQGSGVIVFANMDDQVTVELLQGYSLSLVLITLTLIVGFRSFYFGLLSVGPNLLPAVMVFGLWGLFVGQLDPFVMMLFSISIGLVVDDTVHILCHYLDYRAQGSNVTDAFNSSLATAGPALIVTTAVLALGTTILIAASTLYFQQAARLLVPIVILALVLDLLYLPTVLRRLDLVKPQNIK